MSGRESFIPFFSSVRTRTNQSRANEMPPTVVPVPHGGAAIVFEPDRFARYRAEEKVQNIGEQILTHMD